MSRTECCRTGNRAFSSFVIVFCKLWKVASASWKARVVPAEAPLRIVCVCVVTHRLAGCNLEQCRISFVVLIDSLLRILCVSVCVLLGPPFLLLLSLFWLFLGSRHPRSRLSFSRVSETTRHQFGELNVKHSGRGAKDEGITVCGSHGFSR